MSMLTRLLYEMSVYVCLWFQGEFQAQKVMYLRKMMYLSDVSKKDLTALCHQIPACPHGNMEVKNSGKVYSLIYFAKHKGCL